MTIRIQVRRGMAAEWTDANPMLASGEPGYETDTGRSKYGDGVTAWNDLPYQQGGDGGASYLHVQSSAALTWTMNHNLGFRPNCVLMDEGGSVFDGEITHPSVNQAIALLVVATAGSARLN